MRILGIDPGYAIMGYGILDYKGNKFTPVEYGAITKEQAKHHPQRNVITRALGSEADVEPDFYEINLAPGDMLILCSDGLSNIVSDEEMLDYAVDYPEPEILCRALMSKALNRGARDNVTVVVIKR